MYLEYFLYIVLIAPSLSLIPAEYSLVWMCHNLTNPPTARHLNGFQCTPINIIAHTIKHMTREKQHGKYRL